MLFICRSTGHRHYSPLPSANVSRCHDIALHLQRNFVNANAQRRGGQQAVLLATRQGRGGWIMIQKGGSQHTAPGHGAQHGAQQLECLVMLYQQKGGGTGSALACCCGALAGSCRKGVVMVARRRVNQLGEQGNTSTCGDYVSSQIVGRLAYTVCDQAARAAPLRSGRPQGSMRVLGSAGCHVHL